MIKYEIWYTEDGEELSGIGQCKSLGELWERIHFAYVEPVNVHITKITMEEIA